jgi:hypothetical protein
LKSLILEDLSFAKHNTMLLRPFIKTVADEERSLIVSLIDRSKLENIYEKVQIPTTDSIGKEFSAEMIEQFKHRTEKLANYNEKFLNVMDQIIDITRNECLMVCRQKNKMQERIDKILEFFDMVTQEQIKLFSVFATQKKQASNESYLASHEFFLQFSTPLYHMLTANIFNSSKQSPFSDYIHKKYSRDKINKPIDAEKFISLKSFTQYLASHFCMMLAYRLTYVENALSFGALFSIFDSDKFYAYCWDSEDYNISTFEADARKLEDTIESMVSVIEMASDVSLEDRMIQIIIIASFLKLLRSFE